MPENILEKGKGHRKRLRDKFLDAGLNGFSDYEVIELLLTLGTPRKDCKEAAKDALSRFGSIQDVFEAPENELSEIKGIGSVNVFGLKLIKAVSERYLLKKLINQNPITNSNDLINYLNLKIRDKNIESFEVIYLNAKNRIIHAETLFEGTLSASSVYPREVIKKALANNAAALIFAHNHPSGDPEPSTEDVTITKHLFVACKLMGITVHEHMVTGNNKTYSFADNGFMSKFNNEFNNSGILGVV
ncbi:MAG: DNA repair protein RadC [Desulfobacterales bacterium]|nr:DNA repair protein RadC [Desulfobacterales bacterium]MCP4161608.1 DNA repair protein RadC [Deltaproteobacteria bacterium]